MNEQQLITFLEVAKHLHFRQAAEKLNLTQPAVSAQIRSLEEELGTTLFYRSHVKLTPSGTMFLPYAQKILDLMNESRETIAECEERSVGPVTIGITSSLSMSIWPRLTHYFQQHYPDIQLRLFTYPNQKIAQSLQEGQIDLAISYPLSNLPSHIEKQTLFYDSFSLIVHPKSLLAQKSYIGLSELEDIPLITFASYTPERALLESLMQRYQIHLKFIIELTSAEEIKRFVAEGIGSALIPTISLQNESNIKRVRITSFEHTFPVHLYTPEKRYLTRTVKDIIRDISGIYPGETDSP